MSVLLIDTEKIQKGENPINYQTSSKFYNDKIDIDSDNYRIILDGVILNKLDLIARDDDWIDTIKGLYDVHGCVFFKFLKGTFYGVVWEKRYNIWSVFTDHISSKPIYYSRVRNNICVSNDFYSLLELLKRKKVSLSLSLQGAYLLLSYGFVFEELTICNEVSRLKVGNYLSLSDSRVRIKEFYRLKNKSDESIKLNDAIDEVDTLFRSSVNRAFAKDQEYGYKHISALSGGLDSRMTTWVAHDLGYEEQLNITFSQSKYLDQMIAGDIAAYLKHNWMFRFLDNGLFLKDLDSVTKISGGNVLYYGLAHGNSMYRSLNFDNYGLLHSGQLGDVVVSTFYSSRDGVKSYKFGDGAYSQKLIGKLSDFRFSEDYENEEVFKMHIRGFYGANLGLLPVQKITETYSPFYEIDFLEFCLKIPSRIRYNHFLYKKWIIEKYPKAASFIWEKSKVPVNYKYMIRVTQKEYPLKSIPNIVMNLLGLRKFGVNSKRHMNPLEYWYCTNAELRVWMDDYFNDHIDLLSSIPELQNDCKELYSTTRGTEKNQVLSLLAAAKIVLG